MEQHVIHSQNSSEGSTWGTILGIIKKDASSLDYGSCGPGSKGRGSEEPGVHLLLSVSGAVGSECKSFGFRA